MRILEPQPKRAPEFPAVIGCTLAAALSADAGFLGLVIVVLATRFLGKMAGRGAAAGFTVGIAWNVFAHISTVTGTSASASLIAILAAWLSAEYTRVKRRATGGADGALEPMFGLSIHRVGKYEQPPRPTGDEGYREILDRVPACVCVADSKGLLLYVNSVGTSVLGRPMEEIIGDQWLNYIHPDDAEEARSRWQKGIAASEPVDLRVRMRQYDNVYRWQHLVAEPSFDEHDVVANWYLVGVDIEDAINSQEASKKSEPDA